MGGDSPGLLPSGSSSGNARRSRSRIGLVHSQPGSRSTSPTSLRSYQTYNFDPITGTANTVSYNAGCSLNRDTTTKSISIPPAAVKMTKSIVKKPFFVRVQ